MDNMFTQNLFGGLVEAVNSKKTVKGQGVSETTIHPVFCFSKSIDVKENTVPSLLYKKNY